MEKVFMKVIEWMMAKLQSSYENQNSRRLYENEKPQRGYEDEVLQRSNENQIPHTVTKTKYCCAVTNTKSYCVATKTKAKTRAKRLFVAAKVLLVVALQHFVFVFVQPTAVFVTALRYLSSNRFY